MLPTTEDFWFLPLGGTGEIGMNMNLYGHAGQWLMIDCGISFEEPLVAPYISGTDGTKGDLFRVVAADPSFITEQKENLCGLVITHAHEDHIGGVAHLWPRLKCPVYATPFTAEVLRRKLVNAGLVNKVPIIEVELEGSETIGPFTVRWLGITHSLPEPNALIIETDVGSVFHTADWKIDAHPVTGAPFLENKFKALGKQNILAMVGDSTNAVKPGFSVSEQTCYEGLLKHISEQSGRVIATCFGSNVARLISLARVAEKTGRYMALFGRSLINMYGIAKQQGIWPDELLVIDASHIGYLPANEVLAVATGSQGEPRAALARLANDSHPHLTVDKGDCVIFSSMMIPGNEDKIRSLIEKLEKRGLRCITHEETKTEVPIHASGHPCEEEIKLMYDWVKPTIAVPVHGEPEHLDAHANIARSSGVKITYSARNGDLVRLAPQPSIRRQCVKVGRVPIEH